MKTGVTNRTWKKNVNKYSNASKLAWDNLNKFVDKYCNKPLNIEDNIFRDELCKIVDDYIKFNYEMLMWCHKNGVDPREFACDVINHDK